MARVIDLKTWPEYFESVADGSKTFELRSNERKFMVGDVLNLREWDNEDKRYTGRILRKRVSYVLSGGKFGLDPHFCVLGLGEVTTDGSDF